MPGCESFCGQNADAFALIRPSRAFFDKKDYDLLRIVCDVVNREDAPAHKKLLAPYMHPHGIKEMAATRGLRIAYAVVHLLGSLETGKAEDRLSALRGLHAEVLTTAQGGMRRNTARVLVQLMKDMVRASGDAQAQLMLAHDFREAISGRPRVIRRHLARYHLLEMPEDQSQIAFDDHVHDANTKGRKSSTHLVMDAWIKGIKSLTVIYYNHVPREVAAELLEAARVMEIKVRIGIEFSPRFRGRYLKLIWVPGGFASPAEFLDFLDQAETKRFLAESRLVSLHHQGYVRAVFDAFNAVHRPSLLRDYGLDLPALPEPEFRRFVGAGQASLEHLGKFIHDRLLPLMKAQAAFLRHELATATAPERAEIRQQLARLRELDTDEILERFLTPGKNPTLPDPGVPTDGPEVPELLKLAPHELTARLQGIHALGRITLSLGSLCVEDVLEILYDCKGAVTHLEIVNLKERARGQEIDAERINALQEALNTANVIKLKKQIRGIIAGVSSRARREKLSEILYDISTLRSYYLKTPLASCIGTDSTGQSSRLFGMGMVVVDTLPARARRALARMGGGEQRRLDVTVSARKRVTDLPEDEREPQSDLLRCLGAVLPPLRALSRRRGVEWLAENYRLTPGVPGNVSLMGGVQREHGAEAGLEESEPGRPPRRRLPHLRYLNSHLKITLKVLAGLLPAMLTFALTKDWWVLAWFGAFIWFGITGVRNVIQMVLGSGGFKRSSLVQWNGLVSWGRLADSLLYTGFSVPLLDYLVKTQFLNNTLGITLGTDPLALYSVMALANGAYIFSHNILRGLPMAAAVGNLFRSVLSIPLALAYSAAIVFALTATGHPAAALAVGPWAAVISKLASDCVAGLIEGAADRSQFIRMRAWDYRGKLNQLFDTFQQLELRFPQEDVLALLESPKQFMLTMSYEHKGLENIIIVNALDLLYFWMYQPRARGVMASFLRDMGPEERRVFLLSQYVLLREREISQLFLDGLVGKHFARALSFYLDMSREYLDDIQDLAARLAVGEK
ncbi:MAG: hypothetical protein KKA55_04815 [Proteobacteria bacterium]|nr:hypothetical protein [Pseudomonadota bacterium]MBU1594839.1 hypothetical protein [Pseudomonadota bacterium]